MTGDKGPERTRSVMATENSARKKILVPKTEQDFEDKLILLLTMPAAESQ
jgi:hypothetical protein